MRLKILSWNIWVDCRFADFKRFIDGAGADIVGLQEVREGDPTRDAVGYMNLLGYKHIYAPKQLWKRGEEFRFGPALFSKYDISLGTIHKLSDEHERFAVQADIAIGDTLLHVFSTHLMHTHQESSPIQDEQVKKLLAHVPAKRALVLGDFNATPGSAVVRTMTSVLNNTDPSLQPTWSVYPEGCGICKPQAVETRLDYIFATKDLRTSDPQVGVSQASDHLPISVSVEL